MAYKDVYDNAYPILKKYNLKADVYVISSWLDGSTYMTKDMVRELSDSNVFEIGSHSLSHASLALLSETDAEKELKESKEELESITSASITSIAYPKGSYDTKTINIVKKYYSHALTTASGYNYSKTYKSLALNRLKVSRGLSINAFASLL